MKRVLVINPGSTSTKIGLYETPEKSQKLEITHSPEELSRFKKNLEQTEFRSERVKKALSEWKTAVSDLSAVIGRGGPLKPLQGGVYRINEAMLGDIKSGKVVDHASILGSLIAYDISSAANIPAFMADPVSVDEFEEVARISGLPELPRISLGHALNIKAVVHEVSADMRKKPEDLNFVVAHLGGGISIAAHKRGKQVDVNNANDSGPFSPERVGTLPLAGLLKLCFSGSFTLDQMKKKLIGKGGLLAHLGTSDVREIDKRIETGDAKAALILEAMAYAISKEIGAMATVMKGKVHGIILTGGIAYNKRVVNWIKERVSFIAEVIVKPGQNELKSLAEHAFRALSNPEIVKEY